MSVADVLRWYDVSLAIFILAATAAIFHEAHRVWRRPIRWHIRLVITANTMLVASLALERADNFGEPMKWIHVDTVGFSYPEPLLVGVALTVELASLVVMYLVYRRGRMRPSDPTRA